MNHRILAFLSEVFSLQYESTARSGYWFATMVGQMGLTMWALVSALMALVTRLPAAQILMTVFTISACVSFTLLTVNKKWDRVREQSIPLWIINIAGVCGSEALFVLASKNAPQAHVNLINYLWPTFVIVLAPLLPNEEFELKYIVSAIIGFLGITILLTHGQGLSMLEWQYSLGYFYAFSCALLWAVYSLGVRKFTRQIPEAVGLYCGLGAVIMWLINPHFDGYIQPTSFEMGLLIYMGVTSHNLAYSCWAYGINKGHYRLLSLLCYVSPFISIGTLVVLGIAETSQQLWISAIFICLAGLNSAINWHHVSRLFDRKAPNGHF